MGALVPRCFSLGATLACCLLAVGVSWQAHANGSALTERDQSLLFQKWNDSLSPAPVVLDLESLKTRFETWTADDSMAPFYGEDGCWGRAHRIAEELGESARRVWVYSSGPESLVLRNKAALPDGVASISWVYHVAVLVPVKVAENDFRWYVIDPAMGYGEGPQELSRWLQLFVNDPERAQFLSSPGFVPAGFKNLGGAIPTTAQPDDGSGRYQDPSGDWYLRNWKDPVWETFDEEKLHRARQLESRIPELYKTESARRRLRGSVMGLQSPPREESFPGTIRLVSKWNGAYWVSFEGRALWYRMPDASPRPLAGQRVQVRVLVDRILSSRRAL
jgi:hypothetical protein